MNHSFRQKNGLGQLNLLKYEDTFSQNFYEQKADFTFHTIAWNQGESQIVTVDEVKHRFEANSILPIMLNQSFYFERPQDIVAWQFNREFYCIANHDAEVGCVGFLFFGPSPTMFVKLDADDIDMLQRLLKVFDEEFLSDEDIKEEMLRMLLVRLIIKITRLAKKQYLGKEEVVEDKFNLIRQFYLLVEIHFRKEHQVQFYAGLLNKSPKTISNYFSLYSKKTPLQIISERIITEAKRLFYYTDKSVKEVADEMGFEDVAHFSKFFKKSTSQSPSELKKASQSIR
ncbi:MAG: helix-turn-helix domain-containing protein [Saprospiraceae bacterium]